MEKWTDIRNIYIPPITNRGFKGNIIIRKYIPPKISSGLKKEEAYSEDASPMFVTDMAYEDDSTVLVQDLKGMTVIKRLKTGEIIPISENEFVIGKQTGADYVISDNPTISRKHARLYWEDGGYWLEDLDSSNHVFVDGKRIYRPVRLSDGMRFRLSDDETFEVREKNYKSDNNV